MTVAPSYLHATAAVTRRASEVLAALHTDGPDLATEATRRAVAAVHPLLRRGRFLRTAAPRVETEIPASGPTAIRVIWNRNDADRWPPTTPFATRPTSRWWRTDEEESGWPTAAVDIIVEPRENGAQIAAMSSRPPGTDLSTSRVDRHLRDRIARAAIEQFLDALAAHLSASPARGACPVDGAPIQATAHGRLSVSPPTRSPG